MSIHFPELPVNKREYFAACALQGMLAGMYSQNLSSKEIHPERAADAAVEWADLLIAALEKKK